MSMIRFNNFSIRKQNAQVVLHADCLYEPTIDEKGSFELGTPICWDETLLSRLCFTGYINYHIFSHTIAREKVNRITDYKKVWGLCNIPEGVYSNYYDNSASRTYFGIDVSHDDIGFRSRSSSVIVLCPNDQMIPYETLFSFFCNSKNNYFESPNFTHLKSISDLLPKCIVLHYSFNGYAQLIVLGNSVESLFYNNDCSVWENLNHYDRSQCVRRVEA